LTGRFYEDFNVGERFVTPSRTVTEADIVNFAGVSCDFYYLHTDEEKARRTMFGGRIAHGMLVVSIVTGLWFRLGIFGDSIIALYGIDRLRFTAPVRPGDTIRAVLTVTEKVEKRIGGLVTFRNEVLNHDDRLVAVFDAKLLIKYREERE
jgi:oxepin-CoA hydrolase/3-oxo-5,6-dehydrosuberyl-CoA semialdehyde dehydrogenase